MIANTGIIKRFFSSYWLFSMAIIICVLLTVLFQINAFNLKTYSRAAISTLKANNAYKNQYYGDAGILYQQALEISPDLYRIKYSLANAYYKQGRYAEAIGLYKQLFSRKYSALNVAAWNNIGNCYYIQGHLEESLQAYKNALILDDKDEIVRQNFLFISRQIEHVLKNKSTKQTKKNDHAAGDSKKEDANSPNKKGEQTDDQAMEPYRVSDEQMNKLLTISKEQERVPGGLKSQVKKEKRKYTDQPDY